MTRTEPSDAALPPIQEVELKWRYVTKTLPGLLEGRVKPSRSNANAKDRLEAMDVLLRQFRFVVVGEGQDAKLVGSLIEGNVDHELLLRAAKTAGMIQWLTPFEAVQRRWVSLDARQPWADVVESALLAMQSTVELGKVATERGALDASLPPGRPGTRFNPL